MSQLVLGAGLDCLDVEGWICLLVGMLSNEAVNYLLKHWIQEPRPCTEVNHSFHTEYGLPSNHAQFIWFFFMYSLLFLYMRLRVTGRPLWRLLLVLVLLLMAVSVSYSRVYLLYHTSRQVCCGMMVGGGMAVAWFAFTQLILTPLFPCISAWTLSKYLLLRDTTPIHNLLWFEYVACRSGVRAQQKKYATKAQ
uniref:dolichyldiphosphatase 1 n=1 Tax=Myxine glutinosa TaxID=7769 RepID=UPI00358DE9F5